MLEITKLIGNIYSTDRASYMEIDGTEVEVTIIEIHPADTDGLRLTKLRINRDRIGSRFTAWQNKIIQGYCQGDGLDNWCLAPVDKVAGNIRKEYLAKFKK